jgi:hypothetical protein
MADNVDVIIVSFAKTDQLRTVTENCIESLFKSEDSNTVNFHCLIVESCNEAEPYNFHNTETIFPNQEFGYHKFLNIGLGQTHHDLVCIANNDLLFKEGWMSKILSEMSKDALLKSACPICTRHHPPNGILPDTGNYYGYGIRKEMVGWCIVFKRDILQVIGKFDEKFKFWYCDNDYSKTLQIYNIKHALISSSRVDHLESKTLRTLDKRVQNKLTYCEYCYYCYKWEHHSLLRYYYMKMKYRLLRRK